MSVTFFSRFFFSFHRPIEVSIVRLEHSGKEKTPPVLSANSIRTPLNGDTDADNADKSYERLDSVGVWNITRRDSPIPEKYLLLRSPLRILSRLVTLLINWSRYLEVK